MSTEASALSTKPSEPPLAADQCGPWRRSLIDDLEDGNIALGPSDEGAWLLFSDETGTQSPVIAEDLVARGGPGRSRYAVHSAGDGFTNWGAGFGVALGCGYDVHKFDGVSFKVKAGGAGSFRLELLTLQALPAEYGGRCTENCSDYYQAPLEASEDEWYECTVPFDALSQQGWGAPVALDLRSVTGIQFNFALEDVPYDLWVDDLAFSSRSTPGCKPLRKSCR
jgi:hypothetical protein